MPNCPASMSPTAQLNDKIRTLNGKENSMNFQTDSVLNPTSTLHSTACTVAFTALNQSRGIPLLKLGHRKEKCGRKHCSLLWKTLTSYDQTTGYNEQCISAWNLFTVNALSDKALI